VVASVVLDLLGAGLEVVEDEERGDRDEDGEDRVQHIVNIGARGAAGGEEIHKIV
jgi:hypothetical protein